MNSEIPQVHRVERVDDIPVLLATLNKLKVAEILDRHYPLSGMGFFSRIHVTY